MNKYNVQYFLFAFFIFLFGGAPVFSDMIAAKMAAPQPTSVVDVVSFYKTEQAKRKLTSNEVEILNMALFAQEIFGIKEFNSYGYLPTAAEKAAAVKISAIVNSIQDAIQKRQSWDQNISARHKEKIKQKAGLLKKNLGEHSYSWAWIVYQNGDKKEAKMILDRSFEKSYAETMKLTEISGFQNTNPMYMADLLSKALAPMSTADENKSRDDKMLKMRLHVSGLPSMQMMT